MFIVTKFCGFRKESGARLIASSGMSFGLIRNADEPWSRASAFVEYSTALHNGSLATNFMLISTEMPRLSCWYESCFYSPTGSFRYVHFNFNFVFSFHIEHICIWPAATQTHTNTHTVSYTRSIKRPFFRAGSIGFWFPFLRLRPDAGGIRRVFACAFP